eukprot:gene2791-3083_t
MEFHNTEVFQRLKHLHQLGTASYVFPTAEHSRLPHSIGTAHLAHEYTRLLQQRQPWLDVNPVDMQLLEVAGLFHDVGHGPFSHVFESEVLPAVLPTSHEWRHEVMSAKLLEYAVDTAYIDIEHHQVKQLQDIVGSGSLPRQLHWDESRIWQLQIVANAINSIDVDKLDYLMRDAKMIGVPHQHDFTPLIHNSRVIGGNICFHASMQHSIASLYEARKNMHLEIYQNRQAKAAEYMIVDLLKAANPVLGITDKISDPEQFLQLDDSLVGEVRRAVRRCSDDPALRAAGAVLRRLDRKDLYLWIAEVPVPDMVVLQEEQCPYRPVTVDEVLSHQDHNSGVMLTQEDILVHNMKVDHCKGRQDPLRHVQLYHHGDDAATTPGDVGLMRPAVFLQRKVRVYLRRACADAAERQQYASAVLAAFTRTVRRADRFGPDVHICTQEEEEDELVRPGGPAAAGAVALGAAVTAGYGRAFVAPHVVDMDMMSSQHSIGTQQHLAVPMS